MGDHLQHGPATPCHEEGGRRHEDDEGRHEGKSHEEGQSHEESQSHEEGQSHEGHEEEGQGDGDAWVEGKDFGGLEEGQPQEEQGRQNCFEKASDLAKKKYAGSALQKWIKACQAARKELGLKGFQPVGGKTAQGRALYAKTKALYKA